MHTFLSDLMKWNVYIILCSDDSLYTGITTNMERRLRQHGDGSGAKYFRGRQPLRVVYLEQGHSRSSAAGREATIKAMSRYDKINLLSATITTEEEQSMTKADIIARVSETMDCTRNEAYDLVEEVFAVMKDTLVSGENLKISGFGNFEVNQKHDRKGRNPQTGETMTITARRVLTFKPSQILKQGINKDGLGV